MGARVSEARRRVMLNPTDATKTPSLMSANDKMIARTKNPSNIRRERTNRPPRAVKRSIRPRVNETEPAPEARVDRLARTQQRLEAVHDPRRLGEGAENPLGKG